MKRSTLILTGFILLKFFLQYFLISPAYDLHRDEFLHLDQGHHLAWGYLSVPPVTSWISAIIYLLGNSVFWVKFFPALFGALTMVVVWKTIEALNGNLFAFILGATCVLFSVLLRINTLYQPNSLDVLCWTTLYFVLVKYFKTENAKWLYVAAMVFALGFLNKYNIAFLVLGLLPALSISRHRTIFFKKELYLALLLGLILVSPNLLWQYTNGFPVIHHLNELAETQLVHVDRIDFLESQVAFFVGSLVVILAALYSLLVYEPFRKYSFFFASLFFTLLVFLYFKAKDYYAIGLYPIYIAFGAVYLSHMLSTGRKRHLRWAILAMPLLSFIPMYQFLFPNKSPEYIAAHHATYKELGLLQWEDGKDHALPQDFADMLGWRELAEKVDRVYATIPNPENTLVLCDNYGQAGAINFYSKHGIRAVSFNADYVNWFDLDREYYNVIRVINPEDIEKELKEISPYFESTILADSITNPFAREQGTTIVSFVGAKVDINQMIEKEITEVKAYRSQSGPVK